MTKNYLRYAVASALFAASGMINVALGEVLEGDDAANNSIGSAQRLMIDASRQVEVRGIVGINTAGTAVADVDFYSFLGRAGDVVTIDIDEGMKPSGSSARSLDSLIAIYGPDLPMRTKDDVAMGQEDEPNTPLSRRDARLDNVPLPTTGVYTVGVTGSGRIFLPDGSVTGTTRSSGNGSYKLVISGVSPSALQILIDIKPGLDRITRVNPKSKGTIPVALLSAKDEGGSVTFDPLKADLSSIKFGPTGTEASGRCNRGPDANRDGTPDLLCHFDLEAAAFDESDDEGMVTGTIGGMPFEGRGWLKVIPVKKD
jgi:hypothetical protein